jgi:hypothetical protein
MTSHIRDTALRAVGRNVVNFQRLEGILKALAKMQPVEGTSHEIKRKLGSRIERLSKSTLGSAIAGWLMLLDNNTEAIDPPEDLFDITARFAFSLEIPDDTKQRHAEALSNLLVERNALIHEGLLSMDWESSEKCQKLITKLDAQNERIMNEIEFLLPILRTFSKVADVIDEIDWSEVMPEIENHSTE